MSVKRKKVAPAFRLTHRQFLFKHEPVQLFVKGGMHFTFEVRAATVCLAHRSLAG